MKIGYDGRIAEHVSQDAPANQMRRDFLEKILLCLINFIRF